MTIPDQLQFILTMSGMTQEALAQRLGVTFVTLNSWVNGRSIPRSGAQSRIADLFRQVSGLRGPLDSGRLALKKAVLKDRASGKNVVSVILSRPDLLDQFILSLTYNTNSIEGSTLTEAETAAVLFDDAAFANRTLTEHMEARNHRAALLRLFHDQDSGTRAVMPDDILRWHALLMNGIREDAGAYRRHAVRIVGANVPTANYFKVQGLMAELSNEVNRQTDDPVAHAADVHARFEQIHPFSDGNGRVGRLLIQAMLLRANLAPAVILKKKKQDYLACLNKAQTKGSFTDLEEFLCDAVVTGYGMMGQVF